MDVVSGPKHVEPLAKAESYAETAFDANWKETDANREETSL